MQFVQKTVSLISLLIFTLSGQSLCAEPNIILSHDDTVCDTGYQARKENFHEFIESPVWCADYNDYSLDEAFDFLRSVSREEREKIEEKIQLILRQLPDTYDFRSLSTLSKYIYEFLQPVTFGAYIGGISGLTAVFLVVLRDKLVHGKDFFNPNSSWSVASRLGLLSAFIASILAMIPINEECGHRLHENDMARQVTIKQEELYQIIDYIDQLNAAEETLHADVISQ